MVYLILELTIQTEPAEPREKVEEDGLEPEQQGGDLWFCIMVLVLCSCNGEGGAERRLQET